MRSQSQAQSQFRSRSRQGRPRSKSVVSSPSSNQQAPEPWWQHPLVRACAATAITTGLSAALDSRGDPGQWKGAKGAKVAVATVGAALVDGFLATKHPGGVRHQVGKKGVQVAMDEAERKKNEPRHHHHPSSSSRSAGGGSGRGSRRRR